MAAPSFASRLLLRLAQLLIATTTGWYVLPLMRAGGEVPPAIVAAAFGGLVGILREMSVGRSPWRGAGLAAAVAGAALLPLSIAHPRPVRVGDDDALLPFASMAALSWGIALTRVFAAPAPGRGAAATAHAVAWALGSALVPAAYSGYLGYFLLGDVSELDFLLIHTPPHAQSAPFLGAGAGLGIMLAVMAADGALYSLQEQVRAKEKEKPDHSSAARL